MSNITVRLWSDEDLAAIKAGTDPWLATVFMNASTFGAKEIKAYPYHLRRQYVAHFTPTGSYSVMFYATDDDTARRFLSEQYTRPPIHFAELLPQKSRVIHDATGSQPLKQVKRPVWARNLSTGVWNHLRDCQGRRPTLRQLREDVTWQAEKGFTCSDCREALRQAEVSP